MNDQTNATKGAGETAAGKTAAATEAGAIKAPPTATPAPAPVTAEKVSASKVGKPLDNSRLKVLQSSESDYGNVYGAWVVGGTTVDMVLTKEFWSGVAPRLRPASIVRVFTDDNSWYAELLVRDLPAQLGKPPMSAVVALIRGVTLGPMEKLADASGHEAVWKGQHLKWCVERISDRKLVLQGLASREDAEGKMRNLSA